MKAIINTDATLKISSASRNELICLAELIGKDVWAWYYKMDVTNEDKLHEIMAGNLHGLLLHARMRAEYKESKGLLQKGNEYYGDKFVKICFVRDCTYQAWLLCRDKSLLGNEDIGAYMIRTAPA